MERIAVISGPTDARMGVDVVFQNPPKTDAVPGSGRAHPGRIRLQILAGLVSVTLHGALIFVLALVSFGAKKAGADRRLLSEVDTAVAPRFDVVAASTPTIEVKPLLSSAGGKGGSRGASSTPIFSAATSNSPLGQALAGAASQQIDGDLTGGLGTGGGAGFGGAGEAEFFGVAAKGNKVVYVIDRSQSMRQNNSMELAKDELVKSLDVLSETMRFQVIVYNTEPKFLDLPTKELLLASPENVEKAKEQTRQLQPQGGTDHEKALRLALSLSADVIYLLTDAETHETDGAGFSRMRALNQQQQRRGKQASIHVIHFFHTFRNPNPIIRKFAEENNGTYRVIATEPREITRSTIAGVAAMEWLDCGRILHYYYHAFCLRRNAVEICPSIFPNWYCIGFFVSVLPRHSNSNLEIAPREISRRRLRARLAF